MHLVQTWHRVTDRVDNLIVFHFKVDVWRHCNIVILSSLLFQVSLENLRGSLIAFTICSFIRMTKWQYQVSSTLALSSHEFGVFRNCFLACTCYVLNFVPFSYYV